MIYFICLPFILFFLLDENFLFHNKAYVVLLFFFFLAARLLKPLD